MTKGTFSHEPKHNFHITQIKQWTVDIYIYSSQLT